LEDLVTTSLDDYERLALALAQDPGRLARIKLRLAEHLLRCPLFDTTGFTRALERALAMMRERHEAGQPPVSLRV
jgi:predicted O-linked N-acetylglucosamine transferase (SPINDLY family)